MQFIGTIAMFISAIMLFVGAEFEPAKADAAHASGIILLIGAVVVALLEWAAGPRIHR